ncbi:MAG: sigma-70 family RNA polymerase sigma factor, partial [Haliscomenobacter sp.]|uniref:RNA polymerase sigma factor n=1 Tax=Haliscomenobacter sp. TaxID=2717303 RepID=UPI0029B59BC7
MSAVTCNKEMRDFEVIHVYLQTQANPCFTLLYNRYVSKVYAKCISILKNEELAHDATQEIFLKIFLNLAKFGEKAQFSTWVYSITYNFCIDYLRRNKKHGELFTDDIEKAPDTADEVPDEALLQLEVDTLRKVLDEIPTPDRIILLMKYQDDMQIKDIAEILNKTESAVKMQIKRAKEKAQKVKEDL